MIKQTHKHKGVVRSDTGALRAHPVDQEHKDRYSKQCHTLELNRNKSGKTVKTPVKKTVKTPVKKTPVKKAVKKTVKKSTVKTVVDKSTNGVTVDKDGYIYINLVNYDSKGLRVKFQRTEGRKRKIIGLQIEK